jgi:hypothetical protein
MPRVVKRSASQAVKASPSRRSRPNSPLRYQNAARIALLRAAEEL